MKHRLPIFIVTLAALLVGSLCGVVQEQRTYQALQYAALHDPYIQAVEQQHQFEDMALATDNVTGNGPYIQFDSTTLCQNGTAGICNPTTATVNFGASTLIGFAYTAGAGTITNTNTNLTTFNCSATSTNDCYAFAGAAGTGDTLAIGGANALEFTNTTGATAFDNDNTNTTNWNCSTTSGTNAPCYTYAAPASGTGATLAVAGGTPFSLTVDATGALNIGANGTPTTTTPAVLITSADATNCGSAQVNEMWAWVSGTPASGTQILCTGAIQTGKPFTINGNTNANIGGNVVMSSAAAGRGQFLAGNSSADATITGGAFITGSPGMYQQGTTCAQTTTNASPSLVTLTQWGCKLTSGSASAVVFTITFPGSVTLTNAPFCIYTDIASGITTEPTCATTTTTATVTYAVAPGAVAIGSILLVGNGP